MTRPCDEDCNHCALMIDENSRMLTKVLNELYVKFGNGVYRIVEENCPNFTVCYDCRIDDFCHIEGCELSGIEKTSPCDICDVIDMPMCNKCIGA